MFRPLRCGPGVRYHRAVLTRFVAIAVPLLLLTLGLFNFVVETLGFETGPSLAPGDALPALYVVGTWLLESMALTGLFLLVYGRTASRLLDGLFVAWSAWVFRGPLLVLTVASVTERAWPVLWDAAVAWLAAYTLCGAILALLARRVRLVRS